LQYVYSKSGSLKSNKELFKYLISAEKAGAGEIILTSIKHEGLMQGYDYDVLKKAKKKINIPLIANGGAGNYNDMLKAFNFSKVDAVCASSIYHFTQKTPKEAKLFLKNNGISVRI
jgi:cyclase